MFNKKYLIILFVGFIIAGLVGPAQAFELGTSDGVWGEANPGGFAPDNFYYHSGPMPSSTVSFANSNYYSYVNQYISQSLPNQDCFHRESGIGAGIWGTYTLPSNDWNQFSYGYSTGSGASRFAWLGNSSPVPPGTAENEIFLIGKFCHINRPITADVTLTDILLNANIVNVKCDEGWKLKPIDGEGTDLVDSRNMTFVYDFVLDETVNSQTTCTKDEYENGTGTCLCKEGNTYYNTCKYHPATPYIEGSPGWPTIGGSGCQQNQVPAPKAKWPAPQVNDFNYYGCADRIAMVSDNLTTFFTCVNVKNNSITQDFSVSMLGTTFSKSNTPADDCPKTENISQIGYNVGYTRESAITCMCAYGAITRNNVTPVEIINFMALGSTEGIKLSWETTAEMDNLGFNIYRSTSVDGERKLVNQSVIISDSLGGGMGATYEYMDATVPAGITYYYWLQDIPLDDTIDPVDFGPLEALRPLN